MIANAVEDGVGECGTSASASREGAGTRRLRVVILGLSVTSSWGNGHATTYRGLIRELKKRGHHVTFLERDVPWYASNRDLPNPPFCTTILYDSVKSLRGELSREIETADLVIVASSVPAGA